jgi:virginiamycin B lyase
MRAPVIAVLAIIATTLAAEPRVDIFKLPAGYLPTEIGRHGNSVVFVSWKAWPAIDPYLGRIKADGTMEKMAPFAKDHMPGLMSEAPDGTLWLSDGKKTVLWRVAPSGTPEPVTIGRTTLGIAAGPDGLMWATHPESSDVSRYASDGNVASSWFVGRKRSLRSAAPTTPLPPPQSVSGGGTGGSGGRMGRQGRPIPQRKPAGRPLTKEERKARALDARPSWIVVGTDGAAWFSDPTYSTIGKMTAAGEMATYALPPEWGQPLRVVAGRDGALWFAVSGSAVLASINSEGEIFWIDIPDGASALAADSKGRIWFSEVSGQNVGYVEGEEVHTVALPKAERRTIRSMAEGPDGAMWFADQSTRTIGRIKLDK